MKKFIFVCGCARSGTSITTDLIRTNTEIGLGKERFNFLFKKNFENFTPELFTSNRFCLDLRETDTHHNALGEYYEQLNKRWKDLSFIGDKIPSLFKNYSYVFDTFSESRVIFLIRKCVDVAQSWEKRRLTNQNLRGENQWSVKAAVNEWNTSIQKTLEVAQNSQKKLFILSYEDLFDTDDVLVPLFSFLNLETTKSTIDFWETNKRIKKNLSMNRTSLLSAANIKFIEKNADYKGYQQLLELSKN